ncbi:MAG: radical SAM protein [Thermoplasmatota archaeon]
MNNLEQNLPIYNSILKQKKKARYLICKNVSVSFNTNESTESLWKKHTIALQKQIIERNKKQQSLLDLKIELAYRLFQECIFCERRCKIDRRYNAGDCGVKNSRIASEFLHRGEEYFLVPSHTIFFSGCTFHCVFCQNYDISQHQCGTSLSPSEVSQLISTRKNQGAKNVNWVGGDPTSHLYYILLVLKECDLNIPQIWNSNMYCSTETMLLLNGIIDLYLTDYKYGNDKCAQRLSKIPEYSKTIQRNHTIAAQQGDVVVRHLVMPNHIACCSKKILHWISDNLSRAPLNIMAQYHPEYHAKDYNDINCFLTNKEFNIVQSIAEQLHLKIL